MPKLLFSFLLVLSLSNLSYAQLSEEELRLEFDRMEEEMTRALDLLQATVENGQLFQMDTSIFRMFPYGGADEPGFHPEGNPLQLRQLLDQFMGQLSPEDWAEIEQLFDDFQNDLADPDNLEKSPDSKDGEAAPFQKKKKKTKVYSL